MPAILWWATFIGWAGVTALALTFFTFLMRGLGLGIGLAIGAYLAHKWLF